MDKKDGGSVSESNVAVVDVGCFDFLEERGGCFSSRRSVAVVNVLFVCFGYSFGPLSCVRENKETYSRVLCFLHL